MSREIKFRAFIEGEMIKSDSLAFEQYAPISQLLTNCENIMQYTGLADKNGKDIYEGDITEFAGNRCEIRYYEKLAAFGFYFPHNNTWLHFWECDETILRIDLIGNIHENPDLL